MTVLDWLFTIFSEDFESLLTKSFGVFSLRLLLTLVGKLNWLADKTRMVVGAESFNSLP